MSSATYDSIARVLAINSIHLYQKHISPKKGFSCAHRLLHQDLSCSQYIKQVLFTEKFSVAMQHSGQRFRECAAANRTLKAVRGQGGCIVIPCCIPL